jgi:hypothetical protein
MAGIPYVAPATPLWLSLAVIEPLYSQFTYVINGSVARRSR